MGKAHKPSGNSKPKRVVIESDNHRAFSFLAWKEDRPIQDLINEALTRERERLNLPEEIPKLASVER